MKQNDAKFEEDELEDAPGKPDRSFEFTKWSIWIIAFVGGVLILYLQWRPLIDKFLYAAHG